MAFGGVAAAEVAEGNRTARLQAAGTGRNHLPFNEAEGRVDVSFYGLSKVSTNIARSA